MSPAPPISAQAQSFLADASWSWWTQPRAVELSGDLYAGVVDSSGVISLRKDDGATEEAVSLYDGASDDHNNPAFLAVTGKPILVAYNLHGLDQFTRVRRSQVNVESGFGPFGPETLVSMGAGGQAAYVIMHHLGDDDVWMWCRNRGRHWALMRSTDWGLSWTVTTAIFTRGTNPSLKLYMASKLVGATMRCALSNHPTETDEAGSGFSRDVWYCEIDTVSGDITKVDGTVLGNVFTASSSSPISIFSLDQVTAGLTGNQRSWIYDISDDADRRLVWVHVDDNTAPNTSATYRHARHNGTAWDIDDIVAAGGTFDPQREDYWGGVQFETGGTSIVVSRKVDNDWIIERRTTADDGNTWTATELARSTMPRKLVRAWPIQGSTSNAVIYNDHSLYTNYVLWSGDLAIA